ncbi:MAG: hypothetical protein JWM87_2189 [Candidatus Eremiobacteraeota bacterium]|nr:hypothetical protein [Candidatus Eremiobacteraeota bacterium]
MAALARAIQAGDSVPELESSEVAKQLVAILGRPLVALLTGVSATRVVRGWEDGGGIAPERDSALRVALQAALIVKTRFKDGVVRNWFGGHNTQLDDRAPGELVRALSELPPLGSEARDLGRQLLAAARAFVTR